MGEEAEGSSAQEGPLGCGQSRQGHGSCEGEKRVQAQPLEGCLWHLSVPFALCLVCPQGHLGLALTPPVDRFMGSEIVSLPPASVAAIHSPQLPG